MHTTGIRRRLATCASAGSLITTIAPSPFQPIKLWHVNAISADSASVGGLVVNSQRQCSRAYSATPSARTANQDTVTGKTKATC